MNFRGCIYYENTDKTGAIITVKDGETGGNRDNKNFSKSASKGYDITGHNSVRLLEAGYSA